MKDHTVTAAWWDHATLWNADDPHLSDAGHTTDGGRVFGITRLRYAECDRYGCKPVAVIDPDGAEQVERLLRVFKWPKPIPGYAVEDMQAALREFAAEIPKPPEPGVWAVVEAACVHGDTRREWMRHRDGNWYVVGTDMKNTPDQWDSLIEPVLIREGVR